MLKENVVKALEKAVNNPRFSTCEAVKKFLIRAQATLGLIRKENSKSSVLPDGPVSNGGGIGQGSLRSSGGRR